MAAAKRSWQLVNQQVDESAAAFFSRKCVCAPCAQLSHAPNRARLAG